MHTWFPNIPILGSSQMTSSDKVPNCIWATHPSFSEIWGKPKVEMNVQCHIQLWHRNVNDNEESDKGGQDNDDDVVGDDGDY